MMVVLFHFQLNLRPAVEGWYPGFLDGLIAWGNLGVDIFFVLSGFVIVHSVRKGAYSWSYLGRFGLRRSIRLDPPLWVTVFAELVLIRVGLALIPDLGTLVPGWGQILANLTYTQRFLGYPDVVDVFWSLTYEVQFYFVLVLGLVVYHKLKGKKAAESPSTEAAADGSQPTRSGLPLPVVIGLTVVHFYSLLIYMEVLPLPLFGLFIDRWFQFSLGILAWVSFRRILPVTPFVVVASLTALIAIATSPFPYRLLSTLSAVVTAAALLFVGMRGMMDRILVGRTIQFLGRISYSLYLVHLVVGWRFITLVKRLIGPELGIVTGTLTFLGGIGLSILASWLIYLILEAPSVRLARKVRLPTR
jgi:peptidoglycan/LPS O-acetylase OafA/YrhL